MVAVEVYPQAAQGAGCAASYSVAGTDSGHAQEQDWTYTFYQISATAAAGWRFDHFEWTQSRNDGPDKSSSSYNNPTTGTRYNNLCDYTCDFGPTYEAAGIVDEVYTVNYCRAVFVEDATYGDITVTTTPDPAAGGTTSPVSETHHYVGNPSTTFTLTATPNVGYVFEKWLHNGSEYSLNAQTTVTLYFSSSAQTEHYVAKFRISDKILHGANGTILHGSGGTILRGG